MLIESIRREKAQMRYAGKKEGKREGMALQKLEIARLMLENGEPLGKISKYTGLTEEAILKLRQQRNGKRGNT